MINLKQCLLTAIISDSRNVLNEIGNLELASHVKPPSEFQNIQQIEDVLKFKVLKVMQICICICMNEKLCWIFTYHFTLRMSHS